MQDTVRIPVCYNNSPCYDIVLGQNAEFIESEISQFNLSNRKVAIVTDSNVGPLHAHTLEKELQKIAKTVVVYTFTAGEENKNLSTVQALYEFLIRHIFDRNDVLVALGGGVVGDLTGFTAATYLRGIRFFQAPTSLLAMVDSSIGGKTGVDFAAYKNMVGAFYMPSGVYMNLSTIKTLPEREYLSGMGEIIKHGLIKDQSYYSWMKENCEAIKKRELSTVLPLVQKSCNIKRDVVERDPKEQGERALLNFGHSIGHAVEKLMGFQLLHGECVAIGMVGASYISMKRNLITEDEFLDIKQTIARFNLPTSISGLSADEIISVMGNDKKVDAGTIKFILLQHIGSAIVDTTVSKEEIRMAINYLSDVEG
ncbi:MAG: 3-dehydroquinate synthase [Clostridiales bacterium]|nr:3-dehydroquinate synthase [Clostridiales bacterium]